MPNYRFLAKKLSEYQRGEISASSRERAIEKLQAQGLVLLELERKELAGLGKLQSLRKYQRLLAYLFLLVGLLLTLVSFVRLDYQDPEAKVRKTNIVLEGKFAPTLSQDVDRVVVNFPELPLKIERRPSEVLDSDGESFQLDYQLKAETKPKYCVLRLILNDGTSKITEKIFLSGEPLKAEIPEF